MYKRLFLISLCLCIKAAVNCLGANAIKVLGYQEGLSSSYVQAIADDPERPIMWIGTQRDGLRAFDYEKCQFTNYYHDDSNPNSLITNDITSLYPASDGQMWISTYWHGIDKHDQQNGTFVHYNRHTIKGLPSDQTWCVILHIQR